MVTRVASMTFSSQAWTRRIPMTAAVASKPLVVSLFEHLQAQKAFGDLCKLETIDEVPSSISVNIGSKMILASLVEAAGKNYFGGKGFTPIPDMPTQVGTLYFQREDVRIVLAFNRPIGGTTLQITIKPVPKTT